MTWIANLIAESKRDVVFMWHITSGCFSGASVVVVPSEAEIGAAIAGLVAAGALIGFGDPDSPEFVVPQELLVDGESVAPRIDELRRNAPEEYQFLVFAVRESAAQPIAAADVMQLDDFTDGWEPVHVGPEGAALSIGGLNPWLHVHEWRRAQQEFIVVRHPAHRHERHRVWVYTVTINGRTTRFAAGELSNGVWGFYVPR